MPLEQEHHRGGDGFPTVFHEREGPLVSQDPVDVIAAEAVLPKAENLESVQCVQIIGPGNAKHGGVEPCVCLFFFSTAGSVTFWVGTLTLLHSARLLPCARRQRRQVVEGTHHVIAEGTGLEPYSPCQGLVRGQGGLEDVQACVDLTIHLPVAHQADEHLAHPISAPSATHWAGLTGPRWVDLHDGHTREGGLVFDLTMDFAARPRSTPTIHPSGKSSRPAEGKLLQDNH